MWQDCAFGAYVHVSCTHILKSLKKYSSYRFTTNQNLSTVKLHLLWCSLGELTLFIYMKQTKERKCLWPCKCSFAYPFAWPKSPKGFLQLKRGICTISFQHMDASQVLSRLFTSIFHNISDSFQLFFFNHFNHHSKKNPLLKKVTLGKQQQQSNNWSHY